MKRALITGGAGLIGSHLADLLRGEGWRVRVLDTLENAQTCPRGAHLHLDIPSVGFLAHSEPNEGVAPNGAKRAHVGITHAVEQPE